MVKVLNKFSGFIIDLIDKPIGVCITIIFTIIVFSLIIL